VPRDGGLVLDGGRTLPFGPDPPTLKDESLTVERLSPADLLRLVEGRARVRLVRAGMTEKDLFAVLGGPDLGVTDFGKEEWLYSRWAVGVYCVDGKVARFGVLSVRVRNSP
jgi:hypothetical protein